MSTIGGIFVPDYDGALASGFVGVLAAGTPSGPIVIGKYRLFQVNFAANTTGTSNTIPLRFTTGNSTQGHAAPTPTTSSPFIINVHENFFEFDGSIDSINLETFASDGAPASTIYTILPLARN